MLLFAVCHTLLLRYFAVDAAFHYFRLIAATPPPICFMPVSLRRSPPRHVYLPRRFFLLYADFAVTITHILLLADMLSLLMLLFTMPLAIC